MAQDTQPQAGSSDLQTMLTMVQQAVIAVNGLVTTVSTAIVTISDPNGTK